MMSGARAASGAPDPATPPLTTKIMTACFIWGHYRSDDNGVSWKRLSQPADAVFLPNPDILCSIHKYDDGAYGLMRSKDCGETWEELPGKINLTINDIDFAADSPDRVYAATFSGLAVWENGAWKTRGEESGLSRDAYGGFMFLSVAADPRDPNRVYAGAWHDAMGNSTGVWASCDAGKTWRNISFNLGAMTVWALAVNPHNSALYAGTSYGTWILPSADNPAE